jgi:hypothetical protein
MIKTMRIAFVAALAAGVLAGCATRPGGRPDDEQAARLAAAAAAFGIVWEGRPVGATDRGVTALTDGTTTLTTRKGSRIFVLHDRKAYPPSDAAAFAGSDDDLRRIGRKLLAAAGADEKEIAEERILQQFTQLGESSPDRKQVRVLPPQPSHRTLLVTRQVQGVEVISSRMLLNVDRSGRAVFMELAWPDLAPEVVERALRLRTLRDAANLVPRMEGARVEAVQPVILHSPALGFYDDATAALRVIYQPDARQVGQKAVRFIDERGVDVTLPRDVDRPREEPARPRAAVTR